MYSKHDDSDLDYVLFGNLHSYRDLGMINTKSQVDVPVRKTITYDSKLVDGIIDLTDYFTIAYDNRNITLEFSVAEDEELRNIIYRNVVANVNGVYFEKIYVSKYDAYYYGRATVKIDTTSNAIAKTFGDITITINAYPYSYGTVLIDPGVKIMTGTLKWVYNSGDLDIFGNGNITYEDGLYKYKDYISSIVFKLLNAGDELYVRTDKDCFIKTLVASGKTIDEWDSIDYITSEANKDTFIGKLDSQYKTGSSYTEIATPVSNQAINLRFLIKGRIRT